MCVDCGLVLEQLLGGGQKGEEWRRTTIGLTFVECQPDISNIGLKEGKRHQMQKVDVCTLLGLYHMDCDDMIERVWSLYQRIYGARKERQGFRKSTFKDKVAMAFAICNTMALQSTPRPAESVTNLLGLSSLKPLLDLPKTLNLSSSDLECLKKEDYELIDPPPQEYIDVLCAHLKIPFAIAGEIRKRVEEVEWLLYGKHPTVIAASILQKVLSEKNQLDSNRAKEVCTFLGCQQKAINSTLQRLNKVSK